MHKFIHIDMDCFFAAIEMRDDPRLREIPIAVGGSTAARGVICTANYPARRFGVRSAMSTAKALRLCPELKVMPTRMAVYQGVSERVIEIFSRYTHLIEPVSLDEAYLDVTSCSHYHGSATLIAKAIRKAILSELQLTASAGIAPVKFIAKIASGLYKPNGQVVIPPQAIAAFIQTLPLKKIPGVGPKTDNRLSEMGLQTCADVQKYGLSGMLREFGKHGYMIWQRCNGVDEDPRCIDTPRKSVGVEETLSQDIHQWYDCAEIIKQLFLELTKRLTKYSPVLSVSLQGIKFKFSDFTSTTHEHHYPVLDLNGLLFMAQNVWNTRRKGRGLRLVGLYARLRDPQVESQLSLDL